MKRNSQNIFGLLQDSSKPFQIKWKVLKKCKAYSNISKKCNFCLYEKFIIICKKELCSLNRRNELASSLTVKTGPSSALMYLTILFPVKVLQHCKFPQNSPWSWNWWAVDHLIKVFSPHAVTGKMGSSDVRITGEVGAIARQLNRFEGTKRRMHFIWMSMYLARKC